MQKNNKQTNKYKQTKTQINSLTENQLNCSVWYLKRFQKKSQFNIGCEKYAL